MKTHLLLSLTASSINTCLTYFLFWDITKDAGDSVFLEWGFPLTICNICCDLRGLVILMQFSRNRLKKLKLYAANKPAKQAFPCSKERRNEVFGVLPAQKMGREQKISRRGGGGEGRKRLQPSIVIFK